MGLNKSLSFCRNMNKGYYRKEVNVMFKKIRFFFMRRDHKKVYARRLWILGWPIDAICKKLYISKKTLNDWTRRF